MLTNSLPERVNDMGRPAGTEGFALNQIMLRVCDPDRSLAFYSNVLGMSLLQRLDFDEMKFSLYFIAYLQEGEVVPSDPVDRARFIFSRETTLELTHNWGSESDPDFVGYHNGNADPRGFGHIGISVRDVDVACARFKSLGVPIIKGPQDGKIKGIAFITDPDGYWIEILSPAAMEAKLSSTYS